MFLRRGHVYVYISYGVWPMLNISSQAEGVGEAVLVRALQPLAGIEAMRQGNEHDTDIARGPGRLARAMRVTLMHDGADLCGPGPLFLAAPIRPAGATRDVDTHRHHQGRRAASPLLRNRQPVRQRAAPPERRRGTGIVHALKVTFFPEPTFVSLRAHLVHFALDAFTEEIIKSRESAVHDRFVTSAGRRLSRLAKNAMGRATP